MTNKEKEPRMVGGGTLIVAPRPKREGMQHEGPAASTNKLDRDSAENIVKELKRQTPAGQLKPTRYAF